MSQEILTEKQIINLLDKLDKGWNKNYELYSACGTLNLIRKNEDGEVSMTKANGVDANAIIKSWHNIDNDGGDW